jgi:syntaxin-binding protein 5
VYCNESPQSPPYPSLLVARRTRWGCRKRDASKIRYEFSIRTFTYLTRTSKSLTPSEDLIPAFLVGYTYAGVTMFKSSKTPSLPPETDFTKNLRETSFYRYGQLRSLGLTGELTALAVDPILSLFAIGASSGQVHVYGQPSFQFTLPISTSPIKFLNFHPGHNRLVCIDESNTLHSFLLSNISDHTNPLTHPPLPVKEASYTLWGTITAVEQPSPSYTHMFLTVKDGTTLVYDLSRRVLGNWKIGNCWGEYEERMVRSGIPGRRKTAGG